MAIITGRNCARPFSEFGTSNRDSRFNDFDELKNNPELSQSDKFESLMDLRKIRDANGLISRRGRDQHQTMDLSPRNFGQRQS